MEKFIAVLFRWTFVLFILFLIAWDSFFLVGVGYVGVTFNRLTGKTQSFQQGFHLNIPLIITVNKFDVRTQRLDIKAVGSSKDLQEVSFELVLNYHLLYDKVNNLYAKVGRDYSNIIIKPAVEETIKSVAAMFPVEQIIVDRQVLRDLMIKALQERLLNYDIVAEAVNIIDIDFTLEFNRVVEQKQIEEQKIKTAEYQKRQAEELKQKTIFEAEGESRKQQLLRDTVSEKVIALKWIEKWDGKLPQYMLGDKNGVMMTIPQEK
jgi:regulator of protease activity HflC (stomatin/prohibitin superfamily)